MTQATETDDIASAQQGLVAELRKMGMIKSAAVEAAFLAVPRHAFVPEETPLTDTYHVDRSIPIKRDEHGVIVSSVSATYIQARMIEQADLSAGMRVLEIGSGGFNAALLAEVVGPDGHVVSVDIDADVTERASRLLDAAGYGGRVRVVLGDAEHGVPDEDPFDAIIVTVGAWDIAPAWLEQLKPGGRLVVPLRMNGISRSIGFRREGDHLESAAVEVAGFVAMQGDGEYQERIFTVPDGHRHAIKLRFDTGAPAQPDLLDGVLATERSESWSTVMFGRSESFANLHLWFACFLPGFCFVSPDEDAAGLLGEPRTWFPFGTVHGDSFAYLAVRPAPQASEIEFGARAFGPHGNEAAAAMVTQIQAWHTHHQLGAEPTFAYWPTGSRRSGQAKETNVASMEKTHGTVTISWPAAS